MSVDKPMVCGIMGANDTPEFFAYAGWHTPPPGEFRKLFNGAVYGPYRPTRAEAEDDTEAVAKIAAEAHAEAERIEAHRRDPLHLEPCAVELAPAPEDLPGVSGSAKCPCCGYSFGENGKCISRECPRFGLDAIEAGESA